MISLCICTYNRSANLKVTLESLADQRKLDRISEVLVVDNNSTDATQKVAKSFAKALPLRVIKEKCQGLANARNRAVSEHIGNVLLFTDDDMSFEPGWLAAYVDAFDRFPDAQFFGGRILPKWDHGRPRWLKDEQLALISGVLGRYDLGGGTMPYKRCAPTPF